MEIFFEITYCGICLITIGIYDSLEYNEEYWIVLDYYGNDRNESYG